MADSCGCSLADLRALKEQVRAEIVKRECREIEEARTEILSIAERVGVPVEVLAGVYEQVDNSTKSAKDAKVVKFLHPSDRSKQWTGSGRKPMWVREWLESGRYLDQLLV